MLISPAYAQARRRARRRRRSWASAAHRPDVRAALLHPDPPADEARQGAQADDRGAARRATRSSPPAASSAGSPRSSDAYVTARDRANTEIVVQKQRRPDAAAQGHDESHLTVTTRRDTRRTAPPRFTPSDAVRMNRYPIWVYVTVAVAVVLGLLYTLPNFFGESPAVQVSSAQATLKVDTATLGARRGGAQEGGHRRHRRPPRRRRRQGALRRHRHPAQGEGRPRARRSTPTRRTRRTRSRSTCCPSSPPG